MINFIICSENTPILWAARMNNTKVIQTLIAHGAEATDTNFAGWNIHHYTEDTEINKRFPSLINRGNCAGKYKIINVERRNNSLILILFY